MKTHTNNFKNQIKLIGKEIDSKITFGETELGKEHLNAVTPSFQSSMLKSAMKQLNIDSNVYIPVGSVLKYEFGVKVNGEYEYLDFGNYIVKDVEKQEDTGSYKITCYDKILLSMKDYVKMPITYPITIRDYINSMCTFLGLSFANSNDTFVNYNKTIPTELYLDSEDNSLGYTFRDVFDELAQVTASTICINENDEVEIRYINDTGDTIDEEYLKDVNVNFGEKYGKVNSIVLSRSGQSDNVYLRDETSVEENGLCELKIIDNQIMNFNNRSDFLPDILSKLNGIEYYLNDFTSTGITYYDLCDRYNVRIGDITYSCVMFNNEILVTQGLQENVFTEMPEETQTDYTKADKTDRKINQTYIIVDKQNQQIEAVVSQTNEQNQKIAQVTQTVEELNSKISDIADITISAEDNDGQVELDNINQSEPIRVVVKPIGENISYLYPRDNLFPSDTLFPKNRTIRFENTKTEEIFDYELPIDLLYYDSENYDEFILDYDGQSCVINKRVGYNANGSTYVLDDPTTLEFEYPRILLTDGDYKINVLGYNTAYLFVRLMAQNIYTTQFATRAEVTSEINQTANEINLKVDQKLDGEEFTGANIMLQINEDESLAQINADKISLRGKEINLTSDNIEINSERFNVDNEGNVTANSFNSNDATITGGTLSLNATKGMESNIKIHAENPQSDFMIYGTGFDIQTDDENQHGYFQTFYNNAEFLLSPINLYSNDKYLFGYVDQNNSFIRVSANSNSYCNYSETGSHPSSDKRCKENIKEIDDKISLNIIKDLNPVEYNYIGSNKKHRGLIAQEVKETLSKNNIENQIYQYDKERDRYSLNYSELIPDLINCIKYQQEQIEKLEKRIEVLENERK